jgi:hypothetical protein
MKTFLRARLEYLQDLEANGWKVNKFLKVPHATSPDGKIRLWFKAQAVYVNDPGTDPSKFENTHSTWIDIRKMPADLFRMHIITGFAIKLENLPI